MSASRKFDSYLEPIDFPSVKQIALDFADHLSSHFEAIADVLLDYESFEVVEDEFRRALDLFRSLDENQAYFALRIGEVTAFLPRNQPLYSFSCFVLVPSLVSTKVHCRIPHSMRAFFPRLLEVIKTAEFFPNVHISKKERIGFLKERATLLSDPTGEYCWPVTEAVIFTGTPVHADRLRLVFDRQTLFIANGAGHNPLVVAANADLERAVEATLKLQLYNQGQDCAAPNAILVHRAVYDSFLIQLRSELAKVKIGPYRDRHCRVGPISEPEDLKRIEALIVDNRRWLDPSTGGIIRVAEVIVEPTIVCRPLSDGGNYSEVFAPIIIVQRYEEDRALANYFENTHYARNAMYLTVFGDSDYARRLIDRELHGQILHRQDTFLHNTHLHAPGVERGTQAYGGYGYGASSVSFNGKIIPKPTCPQRDIYEYLVKPLSDRRKVEERQRILSRLTRKISKNIPKILGLKPVVQAGETGPVRPGRSYLDISTLRKVKTRYVSLEKERIFHLLEAPNAEIVARLNDEERRRIRTLRQHLERPDRGSTGEFSAFLYAVAKKQGATERENRKRQKHFFATMYQLLFGTDAGPRLAAFLLEADRAKVCELLNV